MQMLPSTITLSDAPDIAKAYRSLNTGLLYKLLKYQDCTYYRLSTFSWKNRALPTPCLVLHLDNLERENSNPSEFFLKKECCGRLTLRGLLLLPRDILPHPLPLRLCEAFSSGWGFQYQTTLASCKSLHYLACPP
jgi:hypothetical protein